MDQFPFGPWSRAGVLPKAVELWTRVMRRPSFRKFLLNRWSDFCILSEKTPSNFRISKNRWKEKWGYLYKLQPKRDYFCMDVGQNQKCSDRLQPKRNSLFMDVGYSQKCADRLQPKRNSLFMDVGYSQKCSNKLQPKRDYFCTDVGHRQKCVNRPHPTRNTHSKDGDK